MSKLIYQNSVDEFAGGFHGFTEIPAQRKAANSISSTSESLSSSFDYLNKKQQDGSYSREDSVTSRSSFSSLIPSWKRSFDSFPGFSISQHYFPRPKKTLRLFDLTINALKDMYKKYSDSTYLADNIELSDGLAMLTRVDNRIILLQALKADYEIRIKEREELLKEITNSLAAALSIDYGRTDVDMIDYEDLCTVTREMCVIESKLERCCGRLQFQIIELDSVSRVYPFDQFELTIRLNDGAKFKSKIKVEKNGHQVWDNTNFTMSPTIDDTIDIRFVELKTLNKSLVLMDKKVPLINDMILPEPSIFTTWVTIVGTIKLRMIVQWNPVLEDLELSSALAHIELCALKDGLIVRKRDNKELLKNFNNRYSLGVNNMLRMDSFDSSYQRSALHGSMGDIVEHTNEEVNIRNDPINRNRDKARAEYGSDFCKDIKSQERPSLNLAESIVSDANSDRYCNKEDCTESDKYSHCDCIIDPSLADQKSIADDDRSVIDPSVVWEGKASLISDRDKDSDNEAPSVKKPLEENDDKEVALVSDTSECDDSAPDVEGAQIITEDQICESIDLSNVVLSDDDITMTEQHPSHGITESSLTIEALQCNIMTNDYKVTETTNTLSLPEQGLLLTQIDTLIVKSTESVSIVPEHQVFTEQSNDIDSCGRIIHPIDPVFHSSGQL